MRKVLLPLTLALTAMGTVQGQNEYSTLVVETKSGTTLEVSLQKSPNVFVSNKEFTIVCGDEVTGYVHDEVRKFYFKPYDSKTFELISEGVADMHCMSDEYLVDELILELGANEKR